MPSTGSKKPPEFRCVQIGDQHRGATLALVFNVAFAGREGFPRKHHGSVVRDPFLFCDFSKVEVLCT